MFISFPEMQFTYIHILNLIESLIQSKFLIKVVCVKCVMYTHLVILLAIANLKSYNRIYAKVDHP